MQLKQEQILKPSTPFNSNIFTWQKRIMAADRLRLLITWLKIRILSWIILMFPLQSQESAKVEKEARTMAERTLEMAI